MNKLPICFLFFLLWVVNPAISQDSVLSIIDRGGGINIFEGHNDHYLIETGGNCNHIFPPCVGYLEINTDLETLGEYVVHNTSLFWSHYEERDEIDKIGDKFVLGSAFYTLDSNGLDQFHSIVFILDSAFIPIDSFQFNFTKEYVIYNHQIETFDDSTFIISSSPAFLSDPVPKITVQKMNLDGDILWQFEIPKDQYERIEVENLEVLSNGDILFGVSKSAARNSINEVIILNPDGELLHEFELPVTTKQPFIIVKKDSNTFYVQQGYSFFKISRIGNVIWARNFQNELRSSKTNSIRISNDGGIVGVGDAHWPYVYDEYSKKYPGGPGVAYMISPEGDFQWNKFYYDPRHIIPFGGDLQIQTEIRDVIQTPKGDLIMMGYRSYDSLNGGGWILKTDSRGCLYGHYHCDTLQIVGDSTRRILDIYTDVVYEWQEEELSIYPNPTSDHLNIEFSQMSGGVLRLVNMKGEMMTEKAFQNRRQIELQLSRFPPGMYLLEYFDVEGRKYSRSKVVIQ